MDRNPKTRQEKKGTGKFYGKKGHEVYSQKHIRVREQLLENTERTQPIDNTITPVKPCTNNRNKR